jgi:uncharacterized protein
VPERIIINTGPLIALAVSDALAPVGRLPLRFSCPPQVRQELDEGAERGYPSVEPPWLEVTPLQRSLSAVAVVALDAGEAAVLQLAQEQQVPWVCIDERRGRQMALAVGLKVVGSLGLLLRAKREGLVEAVRPYVERLQSYGVWYRPELLERVLDAAGEGGL